MKEPKIVNIQSRKIIGIRIQTSLSENRTAELWRTFRPREKEIVDRKNTKLYSIQRFDKALKMERFTPNTVFEKWAGVEVQNHNFIPNGLYAHTLSGGKYAVFIHKGLASAFSVTFQYIFGVWLPNSVYEFDQRDQFEIMEHDYSPLDPNAREEVWIPIKDK